MSDRPDVLDMPWGCGACGHRFGILNIAIELIDGKPLGDMHCPRCDSTDIGTRARPTLKVVGGET